jgi:hypothetical protein
LYNHAVERVAEKHAPHGGVEWERSDSKDYIMEYIDALIVHHKPISAVLLKRLILIFDHIHILHPRENNYLIPDNVAEINYGTRKIGFAGYGILYNASTYENTENQFIDKFDYASHKGILRVTDLQYKKFYERYWLPLRLAYDFDTANKQLLELAAPLVESNPTFTLSSGVLRGGFLEFSGRKIYPTIPEPPKIFSKEDDEKYRYELQLFSVIAKLNKALVVAGDYNLLPVIIDPTLAKLFIEKTKLARNNKEYSVNQAFMEKNKIGLQQVQHLLFKISEKILPDEILEQIPIKELVIARNNTFHDLNKLRRKLASSVDFLTTTQFDDNFLKEIQKYLEKEFDPLFEIYSSTFIEKIIKSLNLTSTFAYGVVGAGIGLMQSLNPVAIALLSGVSATVGSAVSELGNYLIAKSKNDFKNSYSYFLNYRS